MEETEKLELVAQISEWIAEQRMTEIEPEIRRQFFVRDPVTNKPVAVIQGKLGFYPVPICGDDSPEAVDARLAGANAIFENTPKDVQIAVGCSMFGWDTPLAADLSPWSADQS